ncbi:MAG: BatA domain-containing protein [Kiritimatiellae bacterium]|nr:BatA domain-containing protein [Kiritimatiellia bacterium]
MTFLQPTMLWGLPLCLLPVVIHLLNRLRYRSQSWAAMMFLIRASRTSTRLARLRQFLIMLCRVLAVFAVVAAFSRPLAGGWLGWALGGPPDTVLILLDRSAGMEAASAAPGKSRRRQALDLLAAAAERLSAESRLVLIDSATGASHELAAPGLLGELAFASASDTAADFPTLMQAALDYIRTSQAGAVEIWVGSDLQRANWRPDSPLWPALAAELAALPQGVTVRLLVPGAAPQPNASVSVREQGRYRLYGAPKMELVCELGREAAGGEWALPVTLSLDGVSRQLALEAAGGPLVFRQTLDVPAARGGWGYLEIPSDANPRDNRSYFVYGPETHLRSVVVSDSAEAARVLELAAAPSPATLNHSARVVAAAAADSVPWSETALVVWQAPLPGEPLAGALKAFVAGGGALIFLPPGMSADASFLGVSWGEVEAAPAGNPLRVAQWNEREGPLARTGSGESLALDAVAVHKRQCPSGPIMELAGYADGAPFLGYVQAEGRRVFFCSALPLAAWSSLGDGLVLVPLLQRLVAAGGMRLSGAETGWCGRWAPSSADTFVEPVPQDEQRDFRLHAGVYRCGDRTVALNRPAEEDVPGELTPEECRALFGAVPVRMFLETAARAGALQKELWRPLLILAVCCLVAEGALTLPARAGREEVAAK